MALKMNRVPSYGQLSEACARLLLKAVQRKPDIRLALATGHSPQLAYRLFVKAVKAGNIDVSRAVIIKLDEWLGLPGEDPATCECFLQDEIIRPLCISPDRYVSFDPLCADPQAECLRVEQAVKSLGGIDMMVLGVGKNGHLGLNEPGEELCCGAHPVKLADKTREHQMLAGAGRSVTHGMTLGLGSVFYAEEILLLITGGGKAPALDYLRENMVSTNVPASMLHLHRNVTCLVDDTINA